MSEQMQKMYSARQTSAMTAYETAPNTAVIVFHVFADEKPVPLDRSARLDLGNLANHLGVFLIVPSHEDAVFPNLVPGKYDVTVTAVGYLSTHQELNIISPETEHVDIVLQRDPAAIALKLHGGLVRSATHYHTCFRMTGKSEAPPILLRSPSVRSPSSVTHQSGAFRRFSSRVLVGDRRR